MFDNYKNKFVPLLLPVILIFIWYLITNCFRLFSSYILPGSQHEKSLRRRRIREANLFYSQGYDGNAPIPPVDENSIDSYYDQLAGI